MNIYKDDDEVFIFRLLFRRFLRHRSPVRSDAANRLFMTRRRLYSVWRCIRWSTYSIGKTLSWSMN